MKKGSALLIVLGMLSFMVVSAVSFSILMRQNRLPSSYLRRNISARHLVRAALARAIEELEGDFNENRDWGKYEMSESDLVPRFYGVYDDPYPGCGTDATYGERQNGDLWFRRIFMPFGPTRYAECTVPTLTLEGLSYLPPALVDDVRKFSRYTRTAAWRTLPYEAGRYAYVAVNVSDLFDLNRLRAGEPRDSGANRITLSTLFARSADDPFDIDTGAATAFDRLIDPEQNSRLKVGGNYVPFVSLADFNLVVGTGSKYAPFMDYIGKQSTTFLKSGDARMANSLFVNDTYFPQASTGNGQTQTVTLDLSTVAQPFKQWTARKYQDTVSGCMSSESPDGHSIREIFRKNLDAATACLYDYLDSDSIPFSLAFPTTEAVPMVVGVGAPSNLKPQVTAGSGGDDKFEATADKTINGFKYTVKRTGVKTLVSGYTGDSKLRVSALCAYPFKRMVTTKRKNLHTFKARALMKVFLVSGAEFGCRSAIPDLRPQDKNDFKTGLSSYANGVATFTSDSEPQINVNSDNLKVEDKDFLADLHFTFPHNVSIPVCWDLEESYEPKDSDPDNPTPPIETKKVRTLNGLKVAADQVFCPIAADGTVSGQGAAWTKGATLNQDVQNLDINIEDITEAPAGSGTYALQAALWVQVVDESGTVVDMVPATPDDNIVWLDKSTANIEYSMGGDGAPLLNFIADYQVKLDGTLGSVFANNANFTWKALYAVDPRFNHAPEDWFARTDAESGLKDKWCDALGAVGNSSTVFGKDGRDRDVFMFVSDQEYLQDIGELQFLPALADGFNGSANPPTSPYFAPGYVSGKNSKGFGDRIVDGQLPQDLRSLFTAGGWMWRTFSAYPTEVNGGVDPIYALPYGGKTYRLTSNANGFKLNPYSQDDRVIAAALVGTPFDYYVASTNDNQQTVQNTLLASITPDSMQSTYSFGDATAAKVDPDDLVMFFEEIRGAFQERAQKGSVNWMDAWNDLEWQCTEHQDEINDNNKHFLDDSVTLAGGVLHGVDRKFLSSFWRECFDNRQQLFLIFVRAEPQATAGGTIGRNMPSSQLGGRAVALVWRDPAVPTYTTGTRKTRSQLSNADLTMDNREQSAPHRTRILFYHQFD